MADKIGCDSNIVKAEECKSEDTCATKREMKIRFSLSVISEDVLDTASLPDDYEEEHNDCFLDDSSLVALANMTLSVVDDQDPDADDPFCSCDQSFNEMVITPDQADYACISLEIKRLIKEKRNMYLKSKEECKFVSPGGTNDIFLEDTMSAKITIFHVMVAEDLNKAKAVVLNFTDTENFFCCINNGEETKLTIKRYKQEQLRNSTSDPVKPSLVFYMSQTPDGFYHFESALHRGWFLHTVNCNVKMQKCDRKTTGNQFNFIASD
ncbi:uncharacterized protein isoform X1 [Danio rerio]|uniref:Interleukin-1 beta n=2 Tax=Danio rerio TaxID=7955 RepID=F8W2B1_DANRE|nr:uncharacterized protein LOC100150092 [Danio rerio]|eukprot:NP_001269007.1 interleukin-1 receptor antagonist-like [Danio rerio]